MWALPYIGLREKALWRMLYATAARASEVLALDVGVPTVTEQNRTLRAAVGTA